MIFLRIDSWVTTECLYVWRYGSAVHFDFPWRSSAASYLTTFRRDASVEVSYRQNLDPVIDLGVCSAGVGIYREIPSPGGEKILSFVIQVPVERLGPVSEHPPEHWNCRNTVGGREDEIVLPKPSGKLLGLPFLSP